MDFIAEFIEMIYAYLTGLVSLVIPLLAIYLIMRIVSQYIIGDK